MADPGIKNVVVKKEFLNKVTSYNTISTRFRIVAEDKNRKSSWSKIYNVSSIPVTILPGDLNVIGNTVLVNWSQGPLSIQITYDIFAGFDGAPISYVGSSSTTNFSFLKNGISSVSVIVQRSSINPKLVESLRVYASGTRSLV